MSRRMGCTKQLLNFGRNTIIEEIILASEASKLDKIILVLGDNSEKILRQVKLSRSIAIINKNFRKGQSSSLILGLSKITRDYDAFMFILGDQVLINKDIINKLINKYNQHSNKNIIIPTYKKKRGHPIIFGKKFYKELMSISGDIGGRNIIDRYKENIIEISINSNAILFDIDTYKDYKMIKKLNLN